jgi:hypothetical protein
MVFSARLGATKCRSIRNVIDRRRRLWDKPAAAGKTSPTAGARSEYHRRFACLRRRPSPARPVPMSMVQLALKRPYTFIVMAMLIVLATPFALLNMATDIFPRSTSR